MPQPAPVRTPTLGRRAWYIATGVGAIGVLLVLAGVLSDDMDGEPSDASPAQVAAPALPAGPPWHYGRADARYVLTLYADLECPYCKTYYPALIAWIDRHPEAGLRWHHLPLPAHEPAATDLAHLAECAGEAGGHPAFFKAVGWIYRHTRGDGQGIPDERRYPGLTPTMQGCLDSDRPQAAVRAQADEGRRGGIATTPALHLNDRTTGKSLLLHGPVEGDALLSALDLLAADPAPRR